MDRKGARREKPPQDELDRGSHRLKGDEPRSGRSVEQAWHDASSSRVNEECHGCSDDEHQPRGTGVEAREDTRAGHRRDQGRPARNPKREARREGVRFVRAELGPERGGAGPEDESDRDAKHDRDETKSQTCVHGKPPSTRFCAARASEEERAFGALARGVVRSPGQACQASLTGVSRVMRSALRARFRRAVVTTPLVRCPSSSVPRGREVARFVETACLFRSRHHEPTKRARSELRFRRPRDANGPAEKSDSRSSDPHPLV